MEEKIFFNKTARSIDEDHWVIIFESLEDLRNFYETVRRECHWVRFDLNPYEFKPLGLFMMEDQEWVIGRPENSRNRYLNWYEVNEESGNFCTIRLSSYEEE